MRGYLEEASFCPAGRALYAAGSKGKFKVSLSNCYILPSPKDDLNRSSSPTTRSPAFSLYGGGIGINISGLRPKGSEVNIARTYGAVSFMKIFNVTGEVISQNGRRGAMMVGLNCDRPDIYQSIAISNRMKKSCLL